MKIVVIKPLARDGHEHMWVTRSDGSRANLPINAAHDLPHLVAESGFGLEHGFWGLIDAGAFATESRASRARRPDRARAGRSGILAARPSQSPLDAERRDADWAAHSDELIAAKTLTNALHAWGVQERSARAYRAFLARAALDLPIVRDALARAADETIEQVLAAHRNLLRRWAQVEPGGKLELTWPVDVAVLAAQPSRPPAS